MSKVLLLLQSVSGGFPLSALPLNKVRSRPGEVPTTSHIGVTSTADTESILIEGYERVREVNKETEFEFKVGHDGRTRRRFSTPLPHTFLVVFVHE